MARQHSSAASWVPLQRRWLLAIIFMLSVTTLVAFFSRSGIDPCDRTTTVEHLVQKRAQKSPAPPAVAVTGRAEPSPLSFMKSKLVLLVSHELSLSGGPLLLMELAFLLRGVGTEVYWMTIQKPLEEDGVIYNLEQKMLDRGVQ
ncbi:hypothetical protein CRG98_028544, partial [Punica granatum]